MIFVPFWYGLTLAACFLALLITNKLSHFAKTILPALAYVTVAVVIYVGVVTVAFPAEWPGQRLIPEFARVRLVLEVTGCLGLMATVLAILRATNRVETKMESAMESVTI